jgi:hypothetical protein
MVSNNIDDYPELSMFRHLAFNRENSYYDFEASLKEKGYEPEEMECVCIEYGEIVTAQYKNRTGNIILIKNPPVISKIENCVAYSEVGYQRKGATKQFYDDGMWESPCVVDLKTLEKHNEKYFLESDFKENIIDKFIERETFVVYH